MVITVVWVRDNEDVGLHAGSEDRGGRESSKGVSMIEYAGFGIKLHEKRERVKNGL